MTRWHWAKYVNFPHQWDGNGNRTYLCVRRVAVLNGIIHKVTNARWRCLLYVCVCVHMCAYFHITQFLVYWEAARWTDHLLITYKITVLGCEAINSQVLRIYIRNREDKGPENMEEYRWKASKNVKYRPSLAVNPEENTFPETWKIHRSCAS